MKYSCIDCSEDTLALVDGIFAHDFLTFDHIWSDVTGHDRWECTICIRCFRKRLGRDLQLFDFPIGYEANAHINQVFLDKVNS